MKKIKEVVKGTFAGQMYLKARDRSNAIKQANQYKAMLDFYRLFVPAGSTCFDVGANVGNRVSVFLELGARVIAVEPQPACIEVLLKKFENNASFTLVNKALGQAFGEAEMLQCEASTISSMSKQWIEAVKNSGRFSGYDWSKTIVVPVVTLDSLIQDFGLPDFIKIDVEGYEYEVVSGLSRNVKAISLEFTPEYLENCFEALDHLQSIGGRRYQLSLAESMKFHFDDWVDLDVIKSYLRGTVGDKKLFGDIYTIGCDF